MDRGGGGGGGSRRSVEVLGGGGGDEGARSTGVCVLGSCLGVLVLLLMSMAVVHPTEYGLRYNHFTLSIAQTYTEPGRHIIGPWSSIIIFPSTVQTIEFSDRSGLAQATPLKTRTDEGLDLTIHVSFQYKLKPSALYSLYMLYRTDYQSIFQRQAASTLLSVASTYEAEKYWTDRTTIGESMKAGLTQLFNDQAEVTETQILKVDLPVSFENKIVDTEVQKQIRRTREAEQEAAVIRARIDVMMAGFRKIEKITLNTGNANATLLTKTAQAEAQKSRIDVETEALGKVRESMPALTADAMVQYQRGIAYQNVDSAQFMFGVQQAAAIINSAAPAPAPATSAQGKLCAAGVSQPAQMLAANVGEGARAALPEMPVMPVKKAAPKEAEAPAAVTRQQGREADADRPSVFMEILP